MVTAGIPEEQRLLVGIGGIGLGAILCCGDAGRGHDVAHHFCEALTERPVDEGLTCRFDRVEPSASLFAAQRLELLNAGSPTSLRNTVMSMSSEKRLIKPNDFDSDVPPLKRRHG